jgi:hypothetical protein
MTNPVAPQSVPDEEELDFEERAEAIPDAQPLSYFGTDFDVHGLVRRLNQEDIVIPNFDPAGDAEADLAGFQRRFVWRKYQMDRFIESLLLGYPVPGIFLVQQPDKKLLVLDGQQRLRTLQAFYGMPAIPGFKLENVADSFVGKRYDTLTPEERRTLDNTFIHGTIVKYDAINGGDDAVYQVFERLNTGGANLAPHEIRVALYNGDFVRLLRDLNQNESWRELYGVQSDRLKDQELILRFCAFYLKAANYKRPLKRFLNEFVRDHRNGGGIDGGRISQVFSEACALLAAHVGRKAFRATGQLNAALVDSVLVGVAHRIDAGPINDPRTLASAFDGLIADSEYLGAIGKATADEDRVALRMSKATAAFASVA